MFFKPHHMKKYSTSICMYMAGSMNVPLKILGGFCKYKIPKKKAEYYLLFYCFIVKEAVCSCISTFVISFFLPVE